MRPTAHIYYSVDDSSRTVEVLALYQAAVVQTLGSSIVVGVAEPNNARAAAVPSPGPLGGAGTDVVY